MNVHLEPVFRILLPELERAEIEYWVYGGIGIAACAGRFIRRNADVDIFVKDTAFEKTRSILQDTCCQNLLKLKSKRLKRVGRPKLEVIGKGEILSVVPAYVEGKVVRFEFSNRPAEYPFQMLERVERNISSYRFFTPRDEYIKGLFITYLTLRPRVKKKPKIRTDAKVVLTPDEFRELMGE